jgi:hypothetical protein
MKRCAILGALAALVAAPAIVAPTLVAPVQAQDRAEFPDVPAGHWAYEAIDRLSRAGIIEGRPGGVYQGNRPMTRYEFAVAIARLLEKIPAAGTIYDDTAIKNRLTALETDRITATEVRDLIAALRTEFRDELARLGVRVDALETRVSALENRVAQPPRLTLTPSILHRTGSANYINNTSPGLGRIIFNPLFSPNVAADAPALPRSSVFSDFNEGKYSYTDFELRLTDRVTDRLSVNAAVRSLGSVQEDPWAGDILFGLGGGGFHLREAYAVANLGDRSFLGTKGLNLILGRQRTKIAQGLLYDNDLNPTDQIHAQFKAGPFQINAFVGGVNNQNITSVGLPNHPYFGQGASLFFGANGAFGINPVGPASVSGAAVGFPGPGLGGVIGGYPEDAESLVRVGFNLFRISGNPVQVGITRQFEGVTEQAGDSIDLTIPLFNRTIGVEYVKQRRYAFGGDSDGDAWNVTLPVLRSRVLDLNAAYGRASDDFEFFLSSTANPFARTYAEALFDRPLALGAPMIVDRDSPTDPRYAAAKRVWDVSGTLRLFRRLPLDFRYYSAKGSERAGGGGRLDLGSVWTVGSTFNVTPGLDLEVKYGQYNPKLAGYDDIKYFRVGANVGF